MGTTLSVLRSLFNQLSVSIDAVGSASVMRWLRLRQFVTVTLTTFNKQSNGRRTGVESQ